jgi:hypothetical protein
MYDKLHELALRKGAYNDEPEGLDAGIVSFSMKSPGPPNGETTQVFSESHKVKVLWRWIKMLL